MIEHLTVERLIETLAALERNMRLTTQIVSVLAAELEQLKERLDHLERGF